MDSMGSLSRSTRSLSCTATHFLPLQRRSLACAALPSWTPAAELIVPENAQLTPIIYDSPHSGRLYEPILSTWKPRATLLELRRGEDAYMDVVLRDLCKKAGVTLLLQHYPRCYLDVNRAADDVDEESLLQEPWPLGARPTEKSRKGLGLIRRLVRPGCPIYEEGEKLPADEVMRRLQLAYWPYHGALTSALHSLTRRHKEVVHINWHSMKSRGNAMTPDGDARRPDFVVSDGEGDCADPLLTELIAQTLREGALEWRQEEHSVWINRPYKGGHIVRTHGRPRGDQSGQGAVVHSIQIEVNRDLYMNEEEVTIKEDGMRGLQATVAHLTRVLLERAEEQGTIQGA